MSRPRPHFRRPDLIYRAMLRDEQDANPADQLFDSLTRKVMEHLMKTDISEWDRDCWAAFRSMLGQHLKNPLLPGQLEGGIEAMSAEELKLLMNSDGR
jgi:hypothetical protein